jgi:hypothetical protein
MLADKKYARRNRIDDVVDPQAKAMVFERFDFTRKDRAHLGGGREDFFPMFNNPEATARIALVDGSVTSIKLSTLYSLTDPASASQAEIDTYQPAGSFDVPDTTLSRWDLAFDGLENGDGSLLGIPGGFFSRPAFFWATRKGIQGRDIPR